MRFSQTKLLRRIDRLLRRGSTEFVDDPRDSAVIGNDLAVTYGSNYDDQEPLAPTISSGNGRMVHVSLASRPVRIHATGPAPARWSFSTAALLVLIGATIISSSIMI